MTNEGSLDTFKHRSLSSLQIEKFARKKKAFLTFMMALRTSFVPNI